MGTDGELHWQARGPERDHVRPAGIPRGLGEFLVLYSVWVLIFWWFYWSFLSFVYDSGNYSDEPEQLSLWTPFIMAMLSFNLPFFLLMALRPLFVDGLPPKARMLEIVACAAVVGFCLGFLFLGYEFINAVLITVF